MSLTQREIDKLFNNEYALGQIATGLAVLEESGVFPVLVRLGVPGLAPSDASNTSELMAARGSFAAGYQEALDNLRNFIEQFQPRKPIDSASVGSPDFNGTALALKRGDLTEEDIKKGKRK